MKELTILFNQDKDVVTTSIKNSNLNFTPYELYMAYKYLETILNAVEFDWGKVQDINVSIKNKGGKENGRK